MQALLQIEGYLTKEPETRVFGENEVLNFTVAHTPRVKKSGEWVDADTMFIECSFWGRQGKNFGTLATTGSSVFVSGILTQDSYETKQGEKRTSLRLNVKNGGVSSTRESRAASNGSGSVTPNETFLESTPF